MVERKIDERENLIEREKLIEAIKEIAVDRAIRGKHQTLLVLYEKISSLEEFRGFIKEYIAFVEARVRAIKVLEVK